MNRTLIAKEFKAIKWKLLVGFLMLVAVILVMIAMYENMQDLIPPNITEQVPFITAEMLASLSDFTNAMWSNFNDKNLPSVGTIMAILLGIGLLAPEIESGTITLLLTNGVSRKKIFWIKSMLVITALTVTLMAAGILIVPSSRIFGYSLRHLRLIPATLVACFGLIFVFAVSLYISLYVKDRIWGGITSAILFALWSALGFWKSTRIFSPFYYMRSTDYFFGEAGFPWLVVLGFLVATVAVLLLAERRFLREEL